MGELLQKIGEILETNNSLYNKNYVAEMFFGNNETFLVITRYNETFFGNNETYKRCVLKIM